MFQKITWSKAVLSLALALASLSTAEAANPGTHSGLLPHRSVILAQAGGLQQKCERWHAKVVNGDPISKKEREEFLALEHATGDPLKRVQSCVRLTSIIDRCNGFWVNAAIIDEEGTDPNGTRVRNPVGVVEKMIDARRVETGCKSVIGLGGACATVQTFVSGYMKRQRVSITPPIRAFLSQCADASVARGEGFIRPIM